MRGPSGESIQSTKESGPCREGVWFGSNPNASPFGFLVPADTSPFGSDCGARAREHQFFFPLFAGSRSELYWEFLNPGSLVVRSGEWFLSSHGSKVSFLQCPVKPHVTQHSQKAPQSTPKRMAFCGCSNSTAFSPTTLWLSDCCLFHLLR